MNIHLVGLNENQKGMVMPLTICTDTHSATGISPENSPVEKTVVNDMAIPGEMGTYMLRRAHYFNSRSSVANMSDKVATDKTKADHS
jgi:hypothetical protein